MRLQGLAPSIEEVISAEAEVSVTTYEGAEQDSVILEKPSGQEADLATEIGSAELQMIMIDIGAQGETNGMNTLKETGMIG